MDGKIRFNNTDNDRSVILQNVGVNTPNKISNQHTPNLWLHNNIKSGPGNRPAFCMEVCKIKCRI